MVQNKTACGLSEFHFIHLPFSNRYTFKICEPTYGHNSNHNQALLMEQLESNYPVTAHLWQEVACRVFKVCFH